MNVKRNPLKVTGKRRSFQAWKVFQPYEVPVYGLKWFNDLSRGFLTLEVIKGEYRLSLAAKRDTLLKSKIFTASFQGPSPTTGKIIHRHLDPIANQELLNWYNVAATYNTFAHDMFNGDREIVIPGSGAIKYPDGADGSKILESIGWCERSGCFKRKRGK